MQRKLPEQDIAQGSYIALPLTLLLLLAGYNHDKVGKLSSLRRQVSGDRPPGVCPVSQKLQRGLGSCPGVPVSPSGVISSSDIISNP